MLKFLLLFIFLAVQFEAMAAGGFGPEWTFTNAEIIHGDQIEDQGEAQHQARTKWLEAIPSDCPECRVSDGGVYIGTDFLVTIKPDHYVLEVNETPRTVAQFQEMAPLIQHAIFDTAAQVGLTPHSRLGGGHIHLSRVGNFKGKPLLQRNFIVDEFNHPELSMGALSHDYLNAPPLAVLGSTALDNFERILKSYDAGEISLEQFEERIQTEVYKSGENMVRHDPSKFQALNLKHTDTYELRHFQPQVSAFQYLDMITLIQKRIDYLEALDRPIPFQRKDYSGRFSYTVKDDMHTYKTTLQPEVILHSYRSYVEESGLLWSDYRHYLADPRLTCQGVLTAPKR